MINLLPTEVKEMRSYGRKNRRLVRWCAMSLLGALMLTSISGGGYLLITQAEAAAKDTKSQTETLLNSSKLSKTDSDFKSFSNNLKTVTQILSKQVLFSQLIQKMGAITPKGATLSAISLTSSDNSIALDFKVNSTSLAPTLQANLSDEKESLFDKVDITQVVCQTDQTSGQKTCSVQLKAQYSDNFQFLFLNSVKGGN